MNKRDEFLLDIASWLEDRIMPKLPEGHERYVLGLRIMQTRKLVVELSGLVETTNGDTGFRVTITEAQNTGFADEYGNDDYRCPHCGESNILRRFSYCPDCGAKLIHALAEIE